MHLANARRFNFSSIPLQQTSRCKDMSYSGFHENTEAEEYSSLRFLSNDLLFLVVNQRVFYRVQPLTTDSPASTFIVFDLAKKQTLHSAQMRVTKSPRSVAVLSTGDFLAASLSDVRLCSADLQCKKSFPTHGGSPLDSEEAKKITGWMLLSARMRCP